MKIVYINFFTIYLYNDTYYHIEALTRLSRKNELTLFRCREKEGERGAGTFNSTH